MLNNFTLNQNRERNNDIMARRGSYEESPVLLLGLVLLVSVLFADVYPPVANALKSVKYFTMKVFFFFFFG